MGRDSLLLRGRREPSLFTVRDHPDEVGSSGCSSYLGKSNVFSMAQLTVQIDDSTKDQLETLALREGRSTQDVVRDLVQQYVRDRDRSTALRHLWDRMQTKAEASGTPPEGIDQAIRTVREEEDADA